MESALQKNSMKAASFKSICRKLNEADVRYLVVGGLAVNAHGYVRFTEDVDLVIWLDAGNVQRAFAALEKAGYRPQQPVNAEEFGDPSVRGKWIAEKGMVVLKMWNDQDPQTPLDIFVDEPFDFLKEYSRAKVEELEPGLEVFVVALGTLLKMKEEAGRSKDLNDLEQLRALYGL